MGEYNLRSGPAQKASLLIVLALLTILYQNCSQGGFSAIKSDLVSLNLPSQQEPPTSNPEPPAPPPPPPGETFDISQIKPNHAVELTLLGPCPPNAGTTWGCGAMTDYGSMVYDDQSKKFYMFGGGHGPGQSTSLFTFDLDTQVWNVAYTGDDTNNWNSADADAGC